MDPWKNISHLSLDEIHQLQNEKLHRFINEQIYPFSPYYRKLFDDHKIDPRQIKTVADLARLPFTSKADFFESSSNVSGPNTSSSKYAEFILQPDKEKILKFWPKHKLLGLMLSKLFIGRELIDEQIAREYRPNFMTFTTGTTNTPISYLYSQYDIENLHLSGARMLKVFDIKDNDRLVNIFPFAPHLAFWQVVFGGLSSSVFILSTGGGKVLSTEGNLAAIVRMRPSVIIGVPSYVYHLLRLAKEKNLRMDYLKKIVLGASAVTEPFKYKMAELLQDMGATNISIFGTYGFTEARSAWAECPTPLGVSSGYHLYPDKEIFEIIDPQTLEVKKNGEDGEIVYTSLDARGSTVLRYRTGDFVKGGIIATPCPYCRRAGLRLSNQISRISDIKGLQLSKIKGSLVNLSNFGSIINEFPEITEWQIEIRKKDNDPHEVDELVVYLCAKDSTRTEELSSKVKKAILLATEVSPNTIVFCSLSDIVKRLELETASKEKRVVDSRPK